jgi:MFS family permease
MIAGLLIRRAEQTSGIRRIPDPMGMFRSRCWIVIVFGSLLGLKVGNVTSLQFWTSMLMKPITAEFGWTRGVMSVAVMLGSIFASTATPVAGRLIDRRGISRITLVAIALFALAQRATRASIVCVISRIASFCASLRMRL